MADAPAKRKRKRIPFRWRPMERRTLIAFAQALVDDGLPAVHPRTHDHMLAEMAKTVGSLPRIARDAFHYLVPIIEFMPLVLGRFRTFSRLGRKERTSILRSWGSSPITRLRMPFLGIKALLGMAIASAPDLEGAVGYSQECLTGNQNVVRKPEA